MKHQLYNCEACKNDVKHVRSIKPLNGKDSFILCNECNIELINTNLLTVNNQELVINEMTGDFYNVYLRDKLTKEDENKRYWAGRERINQLAQMDNKPWDNGQHASY